MARKPSSKNVTLKQLLHYLQPIHTFQPQVVHQKGKDLYILFTRWGRIGDTGMYQQTPFPNKAEAVKEFRKIFRAKSANHWKDVKRWDIEILHDCGACKIPYISNHFAKCGYKCELWSVSSAIHYLNELKVLKISRSFQTGS